MTRRQFELITRESYAGWTSRRAVLRAKERPQGCLSGLQNSLGDDRYRFVFIKATVTGGITSNDVRDLKRWVSINGFCAENDTPAQFELVVTRFESAVLNLFSGATICI